MAKRNGTWRRAGVVAAWAGVLVVLGLGTWGGAKSYTDAAVEAAVAHSDAADATHEAKPAHDRGLILLDRIDATVGIIATEQAVQKAVWMRCEAQIKEIAARQ